jgi:hypothetical protein
VTDTAEKTPLWVARERTGLSREMVVRRLDPPISAKTLERMERGVAPLRGYRLKQLAAIYEVPVEQIGAAA